MTASPTTVYRTDGYGAIVATAAVAPLLFPKVKFGDGVLIEQGTSNLILNPSFAVDTTGWFAGYQTVSRDTSRAFCGTGAMKVVLTVGGDVGGLTNYFVNHPVNVTISDSVYVYIPSSWAGGQVLISNDGSGGATNTAANADMTKRDQWQRVSITATYPQSGHYIVMRYGGTLTPGSAVWFDAAQSEIAPYATSYCDGSLGAGYSWDSSNNSLSAAAASFEDGSVGGWAAQTATTTANATDQALDGTHSLKATWSTSGTFRGATAPSVALTAGQKWTASVWVRTDATRNLRICVFDGVQNFYVTGGDAGISTTGSTWTRYTIPFTAVRTAGHILTVDTGSGASTASGTIWIDAAQFEQRTYATPFGATGTANATTSTRTASRLSFPVSITGPLTVCGWVRVGYSGGTQTVVGLAGGSRQPTLNFLGGNTLQFSSNIDAAAAATLAVAAGDLLFIGGTIDTAGTTYTVYGAVNGGTVASAASGVSAAAVGVSTTLDVGSLNGSSNWSDSGIEQVLVYNATLSSAEITALAAKTSQTNYVDDPRIVFAYATAGLRGGTSALAATGSGSQRINAASGAAGTVEPISDIDTTLMPTVPTGTTHVIEASLGVGAGDVVILDQRQAQVLGVTSRPGQTDLVFAKYL